MVYVISQDGKPLMNCSNAIARLLLKQGKAKVRKRDPFTIQLTYEITNTVQNSSFDANPENGTGGTSKKIRKKRK